MEDWCYDCSTVLFSVCKNSQVIRYYVATKLKVLLQFKIIHISITFSFIKSNQLKPVDKEGLRIQFEAILLRILVSILFWIVLQRFEKKVNWYFLLCFKTTELILMKLIQKQCAFLPRPFSVKDLFILHQQALSYVTDHIIGRSLWTLYIAACPLKAEIINHRRRPLLGYDIVNTASA
jgi:hypothetical protein